MAKRKPAPLRTNGSERTGKRRPTAGHVAPRRIGDGIKADHAARAIVQMDKLVSAPLPAATAEEGE